MPVQKNKRPTNNINKEPTKNTGRNNGIKSTRVIEEKHYGQGGNRNKKINRHRKRFWPSTLKHQDHFPPSFTLLTFWFDFCGATKQQTRGKKMMSPFVGLDTFLFKLHFWWWSRVGCYWNRKRGEAREKKFDRIYRLPHHLCTKSTARQGGKLKSQCTVCTAPT